VIAMEASASGIDRGFSPVLHFCTDPRFGRCELLDHMLCSLPCSLLCTDDAGASLHFGLLTSTCEAEIMLSPLHRPHLWQVRVLNRSFALCTHDGLFDLPAQTCEQVRSFSNV
jgi:hypothetical protein